MLLWGLVQNRCSHVEHVLPLDSLVPVIGIIFLQAIAREHGISFTLIIQGAAHSFFAFSLLLCIMETAAYTCFLQYE